MDTFVLCSREQNTSRLQGFFFMVMVAYSRVLLKKLQEVAKRSSENRKALTFFQLVAKVFDLTDLAITPFLKAVENS